MLRWLRKRRERLAVIDAEAKALVRALGRVNAYNQARRLEREANDFLSARHWNKTALMIARMTGRRIGLDTATRMGMNADFSDRGEPTTPRREALRDIDGIEVLERNLGRGNSCVVFWPRRSSLASSGKQARRSPTPATIATT